MATTQPMDTITFKQPLKKPQKQMHECVLAGLMSSIFRSKIHLMTEAVMMLAATLQNDPAQSLLNRMPGQQLTLPPF